MCVTQDALTGFKITGVKYCAKQSALFVAGALYGRAYIMYLKQNNSTYIVTQRIELQLGQGTYINDVALSQDKVFFSDSWKPRLYSIPRFSGSRQQPPPVSVYNLGPEMTPPGPLMFGSNGLAVAKSNIVIVANFPQGALYRVELTSTGSSLVSRVQLSNVRPFSFLPDGLLMVNGTTMYIGDNMTNQVLVVKFSNDYHQANVTCSIQSKHYSGVTTVAMQDNYLWAANAHFTSCFLLSDCKHQPFKLVGVKVEEYC